MRQIPDAEPSRIDRDDRLHSIASADLVDGDPTLKKLAVRVLIGYGDNFARTGLDALLSEERDIVVVGCTADGEQTLALARETQPDVLIVDIALPGIAGVEVARQLVADGTSRVLMLSASEEDEEVFSSLRAGASGFLLKDVEAAELVRAVRTLAAGAAVVSPSVARRVIAELMTRPDPRLPSPDQLDELTPREREVMALVATGLSNDQIAQYLVVTRATAKTHVSRALGKLRARDRAQLVTLAYETGLVLPKKTAEARSSIVAPRLAA
jgi:DNA-binding NarL/FixJ family response regulator